MGVKPGRNGRSRREAQKSASDCARVDGVNETGWRRGWNIASRPGFRLGEEVGDTAPNRGAREQAFSRATFDGGFRARDHLLMGTF
jgi:hypothetical protein